MDNYGIKKEDMARFQAFLKNEPVVAVLNRNRTFLLDEGKRIQSIEVNDKMESYTDGKKVVVSGLPPMITPKFDRRAWLIMMRVNLAHEIQHDNSSDFNLITGIQKWFGEYMQKNHNIRKEISGPIAHSVLNCVEDGRINEIVVQRFPGYLGMMRMVNFAIRGDKPLKKAAADPGSELVDFQNQILSYAKTGLNLPGITVYHGKRLEQEFSKIQSLIDEGVASPTAQGCYDACVKILETSANYIADLVRETSNIMDIIEKLFRENYSQSGDSREEETGNPQEGQSSGGTTIRIHINKPGKGKQGSGSQGDKTQQGSDSQKGKGQKDSSSSKASGSSGKDKDGSDGVSITSQFGDSSKREKGDKDGPQEGDSGASDGDGKSQNGKSGSSQGDGKDGNSQGGADGSSSQDGKNGSSQGDGSGSESGKDSTEEKSSGDKGAKGSQPGKGQNHQESASERAKRRECDDLDDVMGSGFDEEQSPPTTPEELEAMLEAAGEELRRAAASEEAQHVDPGKKTPLSREDLASLKERYRPLPKMSEKFIMPTKKNLPPMITLAASRLHEKLATILMKRRAAASGYKRGYIAPGKLWKVGIGSDDIFQRKQPPKLSNCAVYELIDGSGSMSDHAYSQGGKPVNKLIAALTTASIMEEALKGLASTKITIFRAGWGSNVEHIVIKDFDQKPIGSRCYDAMTEVGPSSGNMDGYSIRIAAMDLAKRSEKTKILLVLSDGLPSAYSSNKEAMADVRSAVKWARTHGITVISIMFGEDGFLKSNYPSYKEMYEQDIIAVKPANITREFEKLLAKLIK